jgi:hypothetical protein
MLCPLLVRQTPCDVRFGSERTISASAAVRAARHLAVQLPRSHMTRSGRSDKSVDGRGDSSDHRRQQRDWP